MSPIAEVSEPSGLPGDTLRHYERIGPLPAVSRNSGGQRRYSDADLMRSVFVVRAQAMGFSLAEIGQLMALRDRPGDVHAMTEAKFSTIEQRVGNLSRLRDELKDLAQQCRSSDDGCPIIARMNDCPDDR